MFIAMIMLAAEPSGSLGAWTTAWIIGVASGIAVMVLATFGWRQLPMLLVDWLKRQRGNAGWAALGMASIAVLALY